MSIILLTVGSVDSIRNLPATALFGSSLIFFFIMGAIFFLLPGALVSAELASMWTESGGVYVWVREAFGKRYGFLAIWLQWIENLIWYPTILSFIAGTIGFIISPELINNKYFLVTMILVIFWGITLVNLFGVKFSIKLASFCSMVGLILPMALIISLGIFWIITDNTLQIDFSFHALLPHNISSNMWVALTGVILSYCGIEIATVHVSEVKNPQAIFPKAMLYSTMIIVLTLILGSLAIAVVIPQNQISLIAGIMQTFDMFLKTYHLSFLLPILAAMLIFGGIGSLNNWIIAPVRGVMIAACDGNLPKLFQKVNKHQAPSFLLLLQSCMVTTFTAVFIIMPSINESYWLLTALAAQLYMFMYLLMFLAAIKLRYTHAATHRAFKIAGGKGGIFIVSGCGILGCLVTLIVGFIPPVGVEIGSIFGYECILIGGLFLMTLLPFFIHTYRKLR